MQRSIFALSLYVCVCFSSSYGIGQDATGVIRGTVINEQAQPVSKAKVSADLIGGRVHATAVRYVETNADGNFMLDRLEWGAYRIYAMKEEENYPNTSWSFYSISLAPTVTLSSHAPSATVSLQIGPKAGTLRIRSLTDAVTGKSILDLAGVSLKRTGVPSTFIGVSPSDHILVPSVTDVTVEIQANGYASWPPRDQAKLGQIRLQPEEVLDLRVQLEPVSGLAGEIERMARRAADNSRLRMVRGQAAGPFPPPEEDIARLRDLGNDGIKALAEYLQPAKDPLEQRGVVSLLVSLGNDQALDLVGEFAAKAKEPLVRSSAVKALAFTQRPKDVLLLQKIATDDADPKVRAQAAKLVDASSNK
jgi:hypothetical protein